METRILWRAQTDPLLAYVCRERRLQSRFPLFAFQRLDERRLLPADVGAGSPHHKHIKIVTRAASVLADQFSFVRFVDGDLFEKTTVTLECTSLWFDQPDVCLCEPGHLRTRCKTLLWYRCTQHGRPWLCPQSGSLLLAYGGRGALSRGLYMSQVPPRQRWPPGTWALTQLTCVQQTVDQRWMDSDGSGLFQGILSLCDLPAIIGFVHEAPLHSCGEASASSSSKSWDFYLI